MLVLLVLAVPICVVIAMISLIPNGLDETFSASPMFILRNGVSGLDSITLIAIPIFVLSGIIMARGGISKKLFNVFSYFIGDKTGGLPCAVVITCLFYSAISGSVFIEGILPGILIGVCLMLYSIYYCKKHGEDEGKLRENIKDLREQGFLKLFMDSFWALLSPVIILGSIYGRICTPTEAAVILVIYALVICLFVYKTLTWNEIYAVLREGVETYAPILFILGAA